MSAAQIVVERDDRIATLRLDGPDRHNVLNRAGWEALAEAVETVGQEDPGCIVIRGTGGRAFSAGSDIRGFEGERDTPEAVRRYSAAIAAALEAVAGCAQPTLAIVDGLCVGGGLEIAAACDLRVCSESSRFGAPIARLGLTMSYEELSPLVALLGPAAVLDILLTGDLIGADRAREIGLVQRVFPDASVVDDGYALAGRICDGAPLVHRWHKSFVRRLGDGTRMSDADREEPLKAFDTEDYREGRAAFLEKRDPRFRGR